MGSEYYTLLLETDPEVHLEFTWGPSLGNSRSAFDLQCRTWPTSWTISRRCKAVGSPSASGPTGFLPWPSLSSLTCMPRPDCVTGPRTRMRGCTPLMVSLRRWRRRWARCSFSSIRDRRPPKPKRDVERALWPRGGAPRDGEWSPFQGNSGSPEPHQGWREPCRNDRLCSLSCLGIRVLCSNIQ